METMEGRRQINGKHAKLYWNGEKVAEVQSFEASVTANREDVDSIGTMDVDSKLVSLQGEGSFTLKKTYSRGMKEMLKAWKEGRDVRSTLSGLLEDPDTIDGQKERVTINNVWFNEMTLMQFESGLLTRDYPFGFTVSSVDIQEEID